MGKITLSFEVDEGDDREDLLDVLFGRHAFCVLSRINSDLRQKLKHSDEKWLLEGGYEYLEILYQETWDALKYKD